MTPSKALVIVPLDNKHVADSVKAALSLSHLLHKQLSKAGDHGLKW